MGSVIRRADLQNPPWIFVSVVVPAYNAATTIRATVQSVQAQTVSRLEIIVIDDGSTDGTAEVLREIQGRDSRLRVFSVPNGGVAASRNRGIAQARARYISFLDADDLWTPDKLESQLKALEQSPEAAIAYSWTDFIDENGDFLHPGSHASISGNVYADLLLRNPTDSGSNVLVRRDVFEKTGGFDETPALAGAADRDFLIRAAKDFLFVAIPKPQVLYRVAASSMSSNMARQEHACVEVLRRNFADAPSQLQTLRPRSYSNTYTYLTMRALESSTSRKRSIVALSYLAKAIAHDRTLIVRRPALLVLAAAKVALAAILPRGSTKLINAYRRLANPRPAWALQLGNQGN